MLTATPSRLKTVHLHRSFAWPWRQLCLVLRELRSPRTLALAFISLLLAIPATVWLTPGVHVHTLGQDIILSAQHPDVSLSGLGQIREGPRAFDLPHLRVYGPIRPQMTLNPVSSQELTKLLKPDTSQTVRDGAARAITMGYVWWYLLATLIVLLLGLGSCITFGYLGAHVFGRQHGTTASGRAIRRIEPRQIAAVLIAVITAWTGSGAAAAIGAKELTHVHSLSDLFGQGDQLLRHSPAPAGPKVADYKGVVMGDSRTARVGGPPVANPTDDDVRCERSRDSIAAELQIITGKPTRNVGCPSATLEEGIEGEQFRRNRPVVPQLALVKQMEGLEYVVLMIGPNDLWWSNLMGYCFVQNECYDNLTDKAFESKLDAFTKAYYQRLIPDLQLLPGKPRIYVVLSYSAYEPDANCPDTVSPVGNGNLHDAPPGGKPGDKILLLERRNQELNAVLRAGAQAAGFSVVDPHLKKLCSPDSDGLGPDLLGISDKNRFHPTGQGSRTIAWQIAMEMNQKQSK